MESTSPAVGTPKGLQPTTPLELFADYGPLVLYALLAMVGVFRLYVHFPGCHGCSLRPKRSKKADGEDLAVPPPPQRQRKSPEGASVHLHQSEGASKGTGPFFSPEGLSKGSVGGVKGLEGASKGPEKAIGSTKADKAEKQRRGPMSSVFHAKFLFHLFLVFFACAKVCQYACDVYPDDTSDERRVTKAGVVVSSALSGCSYITLLLFLEMHWRHILAPQSSTVAAKAFRSWIIFCAINVVMYAIIITAVVIEFNTLDEAEEDLLWSSAITDSLLLLIAVSYTVTAGLLYLRITRSLSAGTSKLPGARRSRCWPALCRKQTVAIPQSLAYPLLNPNDDWNEQSSPAVLSADSSTINGKKSRAGSHAGSHPETSPLLLASPLPSYRTGSLAPMRAEQQASQLQSIDLLSGDGIGMLRARVNELTTRSLSAVSRQQLQDALRVFIGIMLSSAVCILIRGVLSLVYLSDPDTWWFNLISVMGDVPPCVGYLVLMYPRDDDAAVLAGQRSELGTLFGKLLQGTDKDLSASFSTTATKPLGAEPSLNSPCPDRSPVLESKPLPVESSQEIRLFHDVNLVTQLLSDGASPIAADLQRLAFQSVPLSCSRPAGASQLVEAFLKPVRATVLSFSVSHIRLPPRHAILYNQLLLAATGNSAKSANGRQEDTSKSGTKPKEPDTRRQQHKQIASLSRRAILSSTASVGKLGAVGVLPKAGPELKHSASASLTSLPIALHSTAHSTTTGSATAMGGADQPPSPSPSSFGSGLERYRVIQGKLRSPTGKVDTLLDASPSEVPLSSSLTLRENAFKRHRKGGLAAVESHDAGGHGTSSQLYRAVESSPLSSMRDSDGVRATSNPVTIRRDRAVTKSPSSRLPPITVGSLSRSLRSPGQLTGRGHVGSIPDEFTPLVLDAGTQQPIVVVDDDDDDDEDEDDKVVGIPATEARRHKAVSTAGTTIPPSPRHKGQMRHDLARLGVPPDVPKGDGAHLVVSGGSAKQFVRIPSNPAQEVVDVREMMQWECYVVVFVGIDSNMMVASSDLPATRSQRSRSFDGGVRTAGVSGQNGFAQKRWYYVGHTEPSLLEATRTGDTHKAEATSLDGTDAGLYSFSTTFGLSIPVPHVLLGHATKAASALEGAKPVVRIQLRWFDDEDEDAVIAVGNSVNTTLLPLFRLPDGTAVSLAGMQGVSDDPLRAQVEDADYLICSWDIPADNLMSAANGTFTAPCVDLVPPSVLGWISADMNVDDLPPSKGVVTVGVDKVLDILPGGEILPPWFRENYYADTADDKTRKIDFCGYSYSLGLASGFHIAAAEGARIPRHISLPITIRFSIMEATIQSLYAGLVPRSALQLVLRRRIYQHKLYVRSLVAYLDALTTTAARRKGKVNEGVKGPTSHLKVPFASLYGRLIGHLEREEEVKAAVLWLCSRCYDLKSYCSEVAATMTGLLGISSSEIPADYRAAGKHDGPYMHTFRSSHLKKDALSRFLPTNLHVQLLNISSSAYADGSTSGTVGATGADRATASDPAADDVISKVISGAVDATLHSPASAETTHLKGYHAEHPLTEFAHGIITVGAPSAHFYGFKKGQGLCQSIHKMLKLAQAPELSSGRELATNRALRDLEDVKFELQLRADTVMSQALSAAVACFSRSLADALVECTKCATADALRSISHLRFLPDESAADTKEAAATVKLLKCSLAACRLAHAATEGVRSVRQWVHCGYPFTWESLLTCWGKERGMVDDLRFAVAALGLVRFCVLDATDELDSTLGNASSVSSAGATIRSAADADDDSGKPCVVPEAIQVMHTADFERWIQCYLTPHERPTPTPDRPGLVVVVPVRHLRRNVELGLIPTELCTAAMLAYGPYYPSISCVPLLFTQGINEMQPAAEMTGTSVLQEVINADGLAFLAGYAREFTDFNGFEGKELAAARERLRGDTQSAVYNALVVAAEKVGVSISKRQARPSMMPLNTSNFKEAPAQPDPLGLFSDAVDPSRFPSHIDTGLWQWDDLGSRLLRSVKSSEGDEDLREHIVSILDWFSPGKWSQSQEAFESSIRCFDLLRSHLSGEKFVDKRTYRRTVACLPAPLSNIFFTYELRALHASADAGKSAMSELAQMTSALFDGLGADRDISATVDASALADLAASAHWLLPGIMSGNSRNTMCKHMVDSLYYLLHVKNYNEARFARIQCSVTEEEAMLLGTPQGPPSSVMVFNTAHPGASAHNRRMTWGSADAQQHMPDGGAPSGKRTPSQHLPHQQSEAAVQGLRIATPASAPRGTPSNADDDADAASVESPDPASTGRLYGSITKDGDKERHPAAILRLVEDVARVLRGGRISSCKSAKDRTGMSITYEESRLMCGYEASTVASLATSIGTVTSSVCRLQALPRANKHEQLLASALLASPLQSIFRHSAPAGSAADSSNADAPVNLCGWLKSAVISGRIMPEVANGSAKPSSLSSSFAPTVASPFSRAALGGVRLPWLTVPTFGLHYHWFRNYMHLLHTFADSSDAPATSLPFFTDLCTISTKLPMSFHSQLLVASQLLSADILPVLQKSAGSDSIRFLRAASCRLATPEVALSCDPLVMAAFMREWGTRLSNAEKNTGAYRFAFNSLQRAFFPVEYRCPFSVMGAGET